MHSIDINDVREAEITKVIQSEEDRAALQQHLTEIVEGTAFKGSNRSGKFLRYIVDQAVAGHFELLKERVIGMELFGRSPSYETGEDAIVRVTARDVRKRLLDHYLNHGATSTFHITIPLGSYIPEITRNGQGEACQLDATPAAQPTTSRWRPWLIIAVALLTLNLALWGIFWMRSLHERVTHTLPWSVLFRSPHATQLITSDPNLAEIEWFAGSEVTVSDYANHNYIPQPNWLTPEEERFCRMVLRGNKADAVDTPIVAKIAELAQASSKEITVHAARSVKLSDLKSDDNFIFLGSPRSDPWFSLFSDQLDFRVAFNPDPKIKAEYIQNVRPRPHEMQTFVETAPGWTTGQTFALMALVQNPDQDGQVLLLAGLTAEGTEAVGKFATNLPRLSEALRQCGISPSGPIQHFELVLRLNSMAGSSNNIDVVACHILQSVSTQKP
jgi:hypothetical protein